MNAATATLKHPVVSHDEWLRKSAELLSREKELTRLSDELTSQRRELPWTPVEKNYVFQSPQGKVSLSGLFDGRSQLATYHFMFGPDWTEGCPGCSFVSDHLNGMIEHLQARDVTLVLVSRAPIETLMDFNRRMGWHFTWVSSGGNDFNRDFNVSFSKEEVASGEKNYNLGTIAPYGEENPGLSIFTKEADGTVYHTYSTFGRGLEAIMSTYAILDRVPKGRDEKGLTPPMSWVKHHDKYETASKGASACCHEKAKQ